MIPVTLRGGAPFLAPATDMTNLRRAGLGLLIALVPGLASASPLGGSRSSMVRQHRIAEREGLPFSTSEARVRALVEDGALEPITGNDDYRVLASVGHKYARPEVRLLIERLAAQYRAATGEQLVVTSLVRPVDQQPANAHQLSVHPAGMAMDLRVPANAASRKWLEGTLLSLEQKGLLDVTRERRPPHYHVAVFPAAYRAYVERVGAVRPVAVTAPAPVAPTPVAPAQAPVAVASLAPMAAPQAEAAPVALLATLGLGMVGLTALVANVRGRTARPSAAPAECASLLGIAEGR